MTKRTARLFLFVAMFATIGCDRVTKHLAFESLAESGSRSFLGDTFRLEYAENEGAFLSVGSDWPQAERTAVFSFGTGLLLVGVVIAAVRLRWPELALVGVGLLAAGGISNLVDRILFGKVIDFMNIGVGPIRTGIFNVADVAITLGAIIIVLSSGRRKTASGQS